MSKRLAGNDEVPKYGSIWVWEDGAPMMAICDVDDEPVGLPRRWLFLRLLNKRDPMTTMWTGMNEIGSWIVLDD